MKLVKDFYNEIVEKEGQEIGNKFLELMQEWNDGKSVINSYYSEDILQSMLKEAKKNDYPVKAYKFSSTADITKKPDILRRTAKYELPALTPEKFLKHKYENGSSFGIENLQRAGQYRILGWAFDFTPFMKKYVVKQYGSWQEYWAPNKTLLRKSVYGKIDKIVEIK